MKSVMFNLVHCSFPFTHIGDHRRSGSSAASCSWLSAATQIVPELRHLDQMRALVVDDPVALVQQIDLAIQLVVAQPMPGGAGQAAQQIQRLAAGGMEGIQNIGHRLAAIGPRGIQARRVRRRQLGPVGFQQQPGALAEDRVNIHQVPESAP